MRTVFYSWQSDLPGVTNRSFIQDALKKAIKNLNHPDILILDRDTQGVAGALDIATTIFSKIDAADAFVADVSILQRRANKPTPNPNVVFEAGYALRALGANRLVLVFNKAYGRIDQLPFDLRGRRILYYTAKENDISRAEAKKSLTGAFEAALAMIIDVKPQIQVRDKLLDPLLQFTTGFTKRRNDFSDSEIKFTNHGDLVRNLSIVPLGSFNANMTPTGVLP